MKKTKPQSITAVLSIRISHELKAAILKRAAENRLKINEYLSPCLARLVGQPELKAIPKGKLGRPAKWEYRDNKKPANHFAGFG